MSCWHHTFDTEAHETAFAIDPTSLSFGPGVLREVGEALLECRRVALFTDAGQTIQQVRYDPYGVPFGIAKTDVNRFAWSTFSPRYSRRHA